MSERKRAYSRDITYATARSAADEIKRFYGLMTVVIPPHRPCVRRDHPDRIFTHKGAKNQALSAEIKHVHSLGRPILVGTSSVEESEDLAALLKKNGIPVNVLNAKNDEREAAIIARAGAPAALTISTNMAGRGTDIKLGGDREQKREQVKALSGLYVIGTNRHESVRIDNQLRGRGEGREIRVKPGSLSAWKTISLLVSVCTNAFPHPSGTEGSRIRSRAR